MKDFFFRLAISLIGCALIAVSVPALVWMINWQAVPVWASGLLVIGILVACSAFSAGLVLAVTAWTDSEIKSGDADV